MVGRDRGRGARRHRYRRLGDPDRLLVSASLASGAATVGEISGGKFVLGVGSGAIGNPAFRESLGLDAGLRPIGTMREWLVTLRALLAGETVEHQGKAITLHGINLGSPPPKVPVALGALGPNMLALAGERQMAPPWIGAPPSRWPPAARSWRRAHSRWGGIQARSP